MKAERFPNALRSATWALLLAAGITGSQTASAQGVRYSDTVELSGQQQAILANISVFTVLRFQADPGPLAEEVSDRMNADMLRAFTANFPGIPLGQADTRANVDRSRQGRLFCSYLAVERGEVDLVGLAVRCEIGSLETNVAYRRDVAIVPRAEVMDRVRTLMEGHLARLGAFVKRAKGSP